MQMKELGKQWITSEKEYREGEVFVYRQKFTASQVKKAVFYGTALGVYEAELNGVKIVSAGTQEQNGAAMGLSARAIVAVNDRQMKEAILARIE